LVRPVLAAKAKLGLLGLSSSLPSTPPYNAAELVALARLAVSSSAVLLRNARRFLPFSPCASCTSAVICPLATSQPALLSLSVAAKSDRIILVVGEAMTMYGEQASRLDLKLPFRQQELATDLAKLGKPMVMLVITSRPVELDWVENAGVPAVLIIWHGGSQA